MNKSSATNDINGNRRDQIKFDQEALKYLVRHKKYSAEYCNFIEERRQRAIDGAARRHFWLVGHEQIISKFKNLRSQVDYDSNRMKILKTKRHQRQPSNDDGAESYNDERGMSKERQFNTNRRDEIKYEQAALKYLLRYKKYSDEYNQFVDERRQRDIDGAQKRKFWLVGHEHVVSKFKNLRSQADYDRKRMNILKAKRMKCMSEACKNIR